MKYVRYVLTYTYLLTYLVQYVEPQSYVPLGKKGVCNSEMYVTLNNDVIVVFQQQPRYVV